MRVLHVVSGKLYGGVETVLVTLARCREFSADMEPEFALCFAGRLKSELLEAGVPVHDLGEVRARYPLSVMQSRRRLRGLISDRGIDFVICHLPWAEAIFGPAVRAANVPLVFWMHGAAGSGHWLERWSARTVPDLVICNSRFTADTLPRLYPSLRAEVVHYPVAANAAPVSEGDRIRMRAELATPSLDVVVVQASRIEEWKGHTVLIDALALLLDLPDWTCWIAGGPQRPSEGQYFANLRERATRMGVAERIHFLGERDDVAQLMAAADVFCQPNLGPEPFGVAFVEALYAALPVVTSAIGGALEIIDESCGRLTPPADARSVAAALRDLIRDPQSRVQLGAGGPPRARAVCDPGVQARQLAALLAGNRPQRPECASRRT